MPNMMSQGNETQDKENSREEERGQKRRIEAITELDDAGDTTSQEPGSPPAKKVRASPKLNGSAQEATCPVGGNIARSDKSPSEVNTKHNPRDAKGSDAVLVPTIKAPMTKGPATLPLPPTKDKKVRKSMRGVASIKRRVLTEPSAPPHHVSTRPAGAQDPPPSWVLREHLEWIEQEVTLRVAAALALSKNENTPVARARVVPYKDAGTQVDDAVVLAARASPRVRIEKKTAMRTKRVKMEANHELPTTASEQVEPKSERKPAKSAEQALIRVDGPRKSQKLRSNPRLPKNQNPLVDSTPAAKKVRNMAQGTTEGRASATPKSVNPTTSHSTNPAPKKNRPPEIPNWFQMLQPPSKR